MEGENSPWMLPWFLALEKMVGLNLFPEHKARSGAAHWFGKKSALLLLLGGFG